MIKNVEKKLALAIAFENIIEKCVFKVNCYSLRVNDMGIFICILLYLHIYTNSTVKFSVLYFTSKKIV